MQLVTSSMAILSSSNQNQNQNHNNNQNHNQTTNPNQLNANIINDPLYTASSDHPGMVLTNTPFNKRNFHGWSKNVRMTLGAKLKLGFTDGSCPKPDVGDVELQKWIRCDYMLRKEIAERYGQSNGPLIYQLERKLSKISQGSLTIASYFNKLKKCWDELKNINRLPTCEYGKMRECACDLENFLLRDSNSKLIQFLMKLNDEYKGQMVKEKILKESEMMAKKQNMIAAHVNSGFDEHFCEDSPFDMGNKNEIRLILNSGFDQKLVAEVFQETMRMFKGKGVMPEGNACTSHACILSCFTISFAILCHPNMNIRVD
ncbi:retrovirus-related pol polyprotein from transposon TNT 1-94 [Tanacetum coccineum]|uniref:Retrovirus-related pol polyprotein from transposon TNT 1-94 n=1 Tax=Tanacetum coccineum TaxID=301880 RepID=A0ABQ5FLA3_9ASTR